MRTIKQLTDKGDIISVIRILRSSNNPKTQRDALKAISILAKKGIVDPTAIDKINALLFNGNKDIRVQAAFAIGDMAEKGVFKEESLQPLIDLSSKNDTSVRWSTTFALKALAKDGIFDGDAINFFSERLHDRFDKVAYNAAFAIGHLAEQDIVDKSTVFPLIALLSDKNIVCRKAAAFALRNLAMKDIYDCTSDSIELKSLKKILNDFDRSTRIYASEAIEELKKKGVNDSTEVHNYHYGDNIGTQITDSVIQRSFNQTDVSEKESISQNGSSTIVDERVRYDNRANTHNKAPNSDDFKNELLSELANATNENKAYLDVRSGDLHRIVGSYPGSHHRMPVCCNVMRQMMNEDDEILEQPPKGNGANLVIRYHLPRK
jgi:HEAT repeat protein